VKAAVEAEAKATSDGRMPSDRAAAEGRPMFCVSEAQAAVICTAFVQRGELSAVLELRRLFRAWVTSPGLEKCVRAIAGWQPPRGPHE
jgi:hypothetical protein